MKIKSTAQIFKTLADRVGCEINLEPSYELAGQILFPDSRKFYFKSTSLDINSHGASEVAKDKGYTRFFMEGMGYKIPHGSAFFSDYWCGVNEASNNSEAALKFAGTLGYPVIVKPNSGSKGRDVFKAYNKEELREILKIVFENNNVVLIEEYIAGADYRLVVLNNEVMMAYQRLPLAVVGDGIDNIATLFDKKKTKLQNMGRKIPIEISDERIGSRLNNFHKIDINYIPKVGEEVVLLDNANLSSGGEAVDVTQSIHESYKNIAVKLTKDMGLHLAGVDFITTDDITKTLQNPVFIEINSSPGLAHYQTLSPESASRVEDLYYKILLELKNRAF
ncbi:MAG: ATP-grasp domain-containing protein [bacterium]|nr:ATP-grasp domain-containing protein [bacterium]